jgi:hypothetical protein
VPHPAIDGAVASAKLITLRVAAGDSWAVAGILVVTELMERPR